MNICLAGRSTEGSVVPVQIGRCKSHTLITSSVSAQRKGIRQRYIDTDGGSSFRVSKEREREQRADWGIESFWNCLLLSCNWINLASNLFRPVTLLHPHEANLRGSDWVYAQLKLFFLPFLCYECFNQEVFKCDACSSFFVSGKLG